MPSEPGRRSAWGALLALGSALLTPACGHGVGATEAPAALAEPPRSAAVAPARPTTTAPAASASASIAGVDVPPAEPPARAFFEIELAPTEGDLAPLLREHADRARARGLRPFVEFFAAWCGPCKALAAKMNDPALVEAFTGTYVIKLNFDDWQQKLADTGFTPREIPIFYALDAQGRPTGRKLGGDAWGRVNAESMARALGPFFRR